MSIEIRLKELDKFGIKLGLDNEVKVLKKLNNPQEALNIIHIAGTNGKGSTLAMLESALKESGKTVCKYTSPYLISPLEMFMFNGESFTEDELLEVFEKVGVAQKECLVNLTRYEVTTVMMFLLAQKVNCDWLLLETGLGGRLDATNVVNPKYSLITNVSMDHQNILGNTLYEIADEKVQIIKQYGYIGELNNDLLKVLNDNKKKYEVTNKINHSYILDDINYQTKISVDNKEFILSLYGIHQVNNFLLAYKVLKDIGISSDIIQKAMRNVRWPARLEILQRNPLVIYDGAHNIDAAKNLVNTLKNKKFNLYYSTYKDKDYVDVFLLLKQLANKIYYVELDEERGLEFDEFITKTKGENIIPLRSKELAQQIKNDEVDSLICGTLSLYKSLKHS